MKQINIFYYCEKICYEIKGKFTKVFNKNLQVLLTEYRKGCIILNKTIYKICIIILKHLWLRYRKKRAPACNHILYDCQMQNNFLYKDDLYLK